MDPAALYLDLLKRSLTGWIHGDSEMAPLQGRGRLGRLALRLVESRGVRVMAPKPFDPATRAVGADHPPFAQTMVGLRRLDNIQACMEGVLADGIPGDFAEAGVWRGGGCIFMRGVLKARGVEDRLVWVLDSFEGLPPPDPKHPADAGDYHHRLKHLAVGLEEVRRNFERYGLLDDRIRFLKGFFEKSLPAAPIGPLALLRADGDMYGSTMAVLEPLYPKVSVGGYVIIDDYDAVPACRQAVEDFRRARGITDPMQGVPQGAVFWRRSG